jgi:hypothetical protein
MVKKSVTWQSAGAVQTLSQVRTYIESCKDWLMELPVNDEDEADGVVSKLHLDVPAGRHDNNGLVREQIIPGNFFECYICNCASRVGDGHIVVANPFTRAQCLLLCRGCYT